MTPWRGWVLLFRKWSTPKKVHFVILLNIAGDWTSCLPTGRADHPFPSLVCVALSSLVCPNIKRDFWPTFHDTKGKHFPKSKFASSNIFQQEDVAAGGCVVSFVRWHLSGLRGRAGRLPQWFRQRQLVRRRTLQLSRSRVESREPIFCP